MSVASELTSIKSRISIEVKLVAVSKTKPNEAILEAYQEGHRDFGENKVQELAAKYEQLPKDINWHFIGHLQTNKVKYIAPFVHLLHGIDSLKLLKTVEKEAKKSNRIINCLLQLKIAQEESKFGLSEADAEQILASSDFQSMEHVRVVGLMGMATYTSDREVVRSEFHKLNTIFKKLKDKYFSEKNYFKELSMGMSHDYHIALEEGATMVRIGSSIFGERNYKK